MVNWSRKFARIYRFNRFIFLFILLLFFNLSGNVTISEKQARCIVETSSHLVFKGENIPFSVFHAHNGMYWWVVRLQRDCPHIKPNTTIINIDMHSDAYGSRTKTNKVEDYQKFRRMDLGNWMRFLHINNICTGHKVLISHVNLIWKIKMDRCPFSRK